jgi:phosphate transport system permease protein
VSSHPEAMTPVDFRTKGGFADRVFKGTTLGAGALVLAVLTLIAAVSMTKAWPAFREMGTAFFTSQRWSPPDKQFGALAFIYGTLVSSAIALVLAVPVSLGIALFVTQVAPRRARRPIVYLMDLLAVVPSVVFGLWGVLVFSKQVKGFYQNVHDLIGGVPFIGDFFGSPQGRSFFTAGIILAVMITPIITSLAREVIDTTPPTDREGALALGATRWEMIRGAVLPHSKGGLTGAVMLGLGRAMGETIAVALVIGSSPQITKNLFGSGDSMPAVIANQWPDADTLQKSALIGLAVTLFAITILVNMVANSVVQRSAQRSQGLR